MQIPGSGTLVLLLAVLLIAAGCTSGNPPAASQPSTAVITAAQPAGTSQNATIGERLSVSVDSLKPGAVLPDLYTCRGSSTSPPVSWTGVPAGTQSLVLILEDPDAPGGVFTHWLVYNIPPAGSGIAAGQTNGKTLDNGAQQGEGSSGSRGYYPACPPPGSTHRYIFRLYASDTSFPLPTADRAAVETALGRHTLARAEFVTSFGR